MTAADAPAQGPCRPISPPENPPTTILPPPPPHTHDVQPGPLLPPHCASRAGGDGGGLRGCTRGRCAPPAHSGRPRADVQVLPELLEMLILCIPTLLARMAMGAGYEEWQAEAWSGSGGGGSTAGDRGSMASSLKGKSSVELGDAEEQA